MKGEKALRTLRHVVLDYASPGSCASQVDMASGCFCENCASAEAKQPKVKHVCKHGIRDTKTCMTKIKRAKIHTSSNTLKRN